MFERHINSIIVSLENQSYNNDPPMYREPPAPIESSHCVRAEQSPTFSQTSQEMELISQSNDVAQKSLSRLSPTLSRAYSLTMVKSMENIHTDDSIKENSLPKKSLTNMRRSVTMRDVSEFKISRRSETNISFERIKVAKLKVDEAIMKGKIFTILGPYNRVREVLRSRGWVEKFCFHPDTLANSNSRKSRSNSKGNVDKNLLQDDGDDPYDDADDDDIDDDDIDGDDSNLSGVRPWEEDDGIYGIMSRMLKNTQPNLYWTLRKGQVDYKTLRKDQIINHHAKAGTFTTKTGLARCLNQLRWFDDKEPDEFFPRCFIISTVEEKYAFIDDFHFTACASLIKEVIDESNMCEPGPEATCRSAADEKAVEVPTGKSNKKILPKIKYSEKRRDRNDFINHKFLDMAIAYCEFIMKIKSHEDIDRSNFIFRWSCDWDEFLSNYYKVVHEGFRVEGASSNETRRKCSDIARDLKKYFPQFDMEGCRNVWILKPGAKSRGRGIMCYSHLDDVLKLLTHSFVTNENKFIVQKYIERPLLIYNTKFDIRQWFMVTDWNPLTVWWYKDCYLRFCSQQYTLDDFNESVHLSNNSIQHKYHNGPRSEFLPPENMWDWVQFEKWMKREGYGNAYRSIVLPGMKEAVIDVLLCVQDSVEWRKNTFELYGADFMVSENDLKPWLIEINSSPCMSASTSITARLTSNVLDDVFKVVLDRRENRQCDTGRFELIHKQNAIFVPPYIGIDLKLAGISIKNPVSSTAFTERRMSIRPMNDSSKDDSILNKRNSNETSTGNSKKSKKASAIKVEEKLKVHNKRSNTAVLQNPPPMIVGSSKTKAVTSPSVPIALQEKILRAEDSPEENTLSKPTPIIKRTHSPLFFIENNELDHSKDIKASIKSAIVNTEETVLTNDIQGPRSESKDIKSNWIKLSKLPNLINSECSPKSSPIKLERQYKLPTKVEIVNFTVAKKMISTSIKELDLKKKRKHCTILKRPSKSQIFIQSKAFDSAIACYLPEIDCTKK